MPIIAEIVDKTCYETGIRFHEPSQQFIAEVGYHEVSLVAPDDGMKTKRVRTTHYLGGLRDRNAHIPRFRSIKADWKGTVIVLRQHYDAAQESRRIAGLPPLPRFKPLWPRRHVIRHVSKKAVEPPTQRVVASQPSGFIETREESAQRERVLNMTVREAYAHYLENEKKRVGLIAGKGINSHTYQKHTQNLTLGLGLNLTYCRPTPAHRPGQEAA